MTDGKVAKMWPNSIKSKTAAQSLIKYGKDTTKPAVIKCLVNI